MQNLNLSRDSVVNYRLLHVLLLFIPVLQLGFSYYISTQIAGFILLAVIALSRIELRAGYFVLMVLFLISLKILSLIIYGGDLHDAFVVLREFLCLSVIFIAVASLANSANIGKVEKYILPSMLFSTALITVQYAAIDYGNFIAFNFDWFIMNQNTLVGIEKALDVQSRLRPVGFYAEPSYMAFIMVSLLMVTLASNRSCANVAFVSFVCLAGLIMLGSLAGILSFSFLVLLYFLNIFAVKSVRPIYKILPIIVLAALCVALFIFQNEYIDRISNLISGIENDAAAYVRLIVPVKIIAETFATEHWFGLSVSQIDLYVSQYENADSVDNALLWVLIHYGLVGVVLLIVIATYVREKILIGYILVAMSFNGAFFSYDKVIVVSVVLGLCLSFFKNGKNINIFTTNIPSVYELVARTSK